MTTRYTKDHEWVRMEGDVAVVGITAYAVEQLGDIVTVDLPAIGKSFKQGGDIAVVDSVKTAADVYAPIAGEVVAANAALAEKPELVNEAPQGDGWFFKLKPANAAEFEALMDEGAYGDYVKGL